MPIGFRLVAFACSIAASLAATPSRAAASPGPGHAAAPTAVAPTVVEVDLHAVAPHTSGTPSGELQTRAYGARTFFQAFVFHIAGQATGFPHAKSVTFACTVYAASHESLGHGVAHANLNIEGTSYPVTDDIVAVDVDMPAAAATWTCTMSVLDATGTAVATDAARSVLEADGSFSPAAR